MASLHRPTPAALGRVRVVLVQPSHPGNVGACARAMRVMGLHDLALVAPRMPDAARHPEAVALASGATDVLADCRVFETLGQALADATLVVGVSAESREFGADPMPPEDACRCVLDELVADPAHRAALVFGPERTGLSIADVGRCHLVCSIPGAPDYNSLNLAQAVQLLAYVLRRAALQDAPPVDGEPSTARDRAGERDLPARDYGRLATQAEISAMFDHLERALVAIRFLDPAHPKKLMARLRRLFARTRLEIEEVQLLRGISRQAEQAGQAAGVSRADRPADALGPTGDPAAPDPR